MLESKKILVEKCKFFGSKKEPLLIVFENIDEYSPPIYIMFKSGDDLRQDMLTLQMLSVMDRLWLENKIELNLKPYKVIATGVNENEEGVGILEIVTNSETISTMNTRLGGASDNTTINNFS